MQIQLADTDEAIAACYPVMRELRPHLDEQDFVQRIRRQGEQGYQLAFSTENETPVAAAGFRLGENLAWGRFLYVDDLVTLPAQRSRGHGKALLDWLKDHATEQGCSQLHLDSGMQRKEAHRFYQREGLEASSLHFVTHL